jgi:hypothetical protein
VLDVVESPMAITEQKQREAVKMNRTSLFCVAIGFLVAFSGVSVAQDLGCEAEVTLDGGVIEVAASSAGDDTENIQCALNAAADGGYKDVYLTSSAYAVGGIEVTNFRGDFRGKSASSTTITVTDGALACEKGAALRFNQGATTIKRVSLKMNEPCSTAGGSASVIGFYTNPSDCSKRTVTGVVDRVIIEGGGASAIDFSTGITVDAAPECFPEDSSEPLPTSRKALGGLRANRNQIRDLDIGILASVSDGGQVDITSNRVTGEVVAMERLGIPISILDANQNTNIFRNEISYNDVEYPGSLAGLFGTTGVLIGSTSASPNTNKTSISKNTFIDGGVNAEGYGLLSAQQGKSITHEIVIAGNTFNGSDTNTSGAGLAVLDTSKGVISGNSFKAGAMTWIMLASGDPADGGLGATVKGWAIVSNSFSASTASVDVTLGSNTEDNIVGRTQNSPVVDDSGSNDVLESSASASSFLGRSAPIAIGSQTLYAEQLETITGRGVPLRKLGR